MGFCPRIAISQDFYARKCARLPDAGPWRAGTSTFEPPLVGTIPRVTRVDWYAIRAYRARVSVLFLSLLRTIVVWLAKGLGVVELKEEMIIATVWDDVINH